MKSLLDDAGIDIPCENCGRKTEKTIGWIKRNNRFSCSCGTVINLKSNQFKSEIAKVEKSLSSLDKMFK